LALHLTSWQTTFLVGEYLDSEQEDKPIFTVASCARVYRAIRPLSVQVPATQQAGGSSPAKYLPVSTKAKSK
jgi:hypothetical protein